MTLLLIGLAIGATAAFTGLWLGLRIGERRATKGIFG